MRRQELRLAAAAAAMVVLAIAAFSAHDASAGSTLPARTFAPKPSWSAGGGSAASTSASAHASTSASAFASASASASASAVSPPAAPAPCLDLTAGPASLASIIATGPARLVECARAQGVRTIAFDAYFPPYDCGTCGTEAPVRIVPTWLSGGVVELDPATAAIYVSQPWDGMRVTTGPVPPGPWADETTRWWAANALVLRIPPALGRCNVMVTAPEWCAFGPYAGRELRITAHLVDPASRTCAWEGPAGATEIPKAVVVAWCEQQLVVESVAAASAPGIPLPPTTSTE